MLEGVAPTSGLVLIEHIRTRELILEENVRGMFSQEKLLILGFVLTVAVIRVRLLGKGLFHFPL